MGKRLIMIMLLSAVMVQHAAASEDIYEKKCVPCHKDLPTSLGQMFKKYLLIYSSEKFVKTGLKYYLQNPSISISVMSDLFIDTYGIKERSTLSPAELDEAINIYWEKFKIFNKLK